MTQPRPPRELGGGATSLKTVFAQELRLAALRPTSVGRKRYLCVLD